MIYGTVCSGIEAPTVAWQHLGWKPAFFSEIAKFPSAVLSHHFPTVPNIGDFTNAPKNLPKIDLLAGGTPCQSFSIAGLRKGLEDPRGNLALAFVQLAARLRPRWVVWENVPGVLSSNGGRDFGTFLGALAELGYGWAYRVLDAQFFGVPQRRRRVFLVACLGDTGRRAAEVLFEPESVRGDSGESRAQTHQPSRRLGGGIAKCVPTKFRADPTVETYIVHGSQDPISSRTVSPCLSTNARLAVVGGPSVRRLTPRECERLQGFPDDYTLIPGATDTARYLALGNSMAVPVVRWIGERIAKAPAP